MTKDSNIFDDFFSIPVRRKMFIPRKYRVTWPCGSTWDFDRFDLEIPEYKGGEQNGITHCYDTLREAIDGLIAAGCTVDRVKED